MFIEFKHYFNIIFYIFKNNNLYTFLKVTKKLYYLHIKDVNHLAIPYIVIICDAPISGGLFFFFLLLYKSVTT